MNAPASAPEWSVVVPTYNRPALLRRLLEALETQTFRDFEVVVMDDGGKLDARSGLKEFSANYPLRAFRQENQGRAVVRNNAAAKAEGRFLLFLDDDVIPEPDCLARHAAFHRRERRAVLTGAANLNPALLRDDFDRYRYERGLIWEASLGKELTRLPPEKPFITAAHFSMAKTDFERLGGFDPSLNMLEDVDLARRAAAAGLALWHDPATVVWHDDQADARAYVRRLRGFYRQARKSDAERPDLTPPQVRARWRSPLRKALFWPFARACWLPRIQKGGLARALPRKLRYAVYDRVFYGLALYYPERQV